MKFHSRVFLFTLVLLFSKSGIAQNPLVIPPLILGDTFNLTVQSGTTEFMTGIFTPTYGINGPLLAPTLVFERDHIVRLNVINTLPVLTTIHWHGLHLPPEDDGGPHQVIPPSTTWSPEFKVMNDAGTFWYHPHGEGKTDFQVSRGIAGLIIIRDTIEAKLNLPRNYGVDDFPIIVQSKAFDMLGQIAIATEEDSLVVVNGTVDPFVNMPAQVVRLRILNGASMRSWNFGFTGNLPFTMIATDGGLRDSALTLTRLRLSPGERAEILINLTGMESQNIWLRNFGSEMTNGIYGSPVVGGGMATLPGYADNPLNGADFELLKIQVTAQTSSPVTTLPTALVIHTPWPSSSADVTRLISLDPETMGPMEMIEGPFLINGSRFHMDTINVRVKLGDIEEWTLDNNTMIAHPFHIHDIQFYVTEVNGGPVPPDQKGKKDVVLVMPNQTLKFITKFDDFANDTLPFMYHCHMLHHEDEGMMGAFVVEDTVTIRVDNSIDSDDFIIYPNPADEKLFIKTRTSFYQPFYISIFNLVGEEIYTDEMPLGQDGTEVDLNQIAAGIYFLKIESEESSITFKIVRN